MEIKIRELCKSYGKKKALQNFDATFENGIYGILGPNGAGKSTTISIICGQLRKDSGTVQIASFGIRGEYCAAEKIF